MSIASDGQPPVAGSSHAAGRETVASPKSTRDRRRGRLAWILGTADDAVLLLLIVLLFPLLILLVGAPVALLVRLVMAIAR
jgi:hypothetical protein